MPIKLKSGNIWGIIGALALASLFGCNDDSGEPEFLTCKWKYDKKKECPGPVEQTDEVGDGDGDKDERDDGDEHDGGDGDRAELCSVDAKGPERTVYQCNGVIAASMSFETLKGNCAKTLGNPELCKESHAFGAESHDTPAVMACCNAEGVPESEVLTYCAVDLVEQVCRSIPLRLRSLIEKGDIKVGKDQADNLVAWLNRNQQACYDSLYSFSSPGVLRPTKWLVNGGRNKQWPLLKNFTISLDRAIVKSATLPDESEQIACVDNSLNDGEIFEPSVLLPKSPGVVPKGLSESATAPIDGPSAPDAQRITGSARISSRASGCRGSRCSWLAISRDSVAGGLTLVDMNLYAEASVSIGVGPVSVAVDDGALRLYGISHASQYHVNDSPSANVIDVGQAHFVISGATAGVLGFRWATNNQPIVIREAEDGGLVLESFSVAHIDGAGETWTVAIPPTRWD
jgi:hypothetical protein